MAPTGKPSGALQLSVLNVPILVGTCGVAACMCGYGVAAYAWARRGSALLIVWQGRTLRPFSGKRHDNITTDNRQEGRDTRSHGKRRQARAIQGSSIGQNDEEHTKISLSKIDRKGCYYRNRRYCWARQQLGDLQENKLHVGHSNIHAATLPPLVHTSHTSHTTALWHPQTRAL